MDVIIKYPDGRTYQTTEDGFTQNHKPYGAEITAYVGADGRSYPFDKDGKKAATEAVNPNWTQYNQDAADRQTKAGELTEATTDKTESTDSKKG